MRRAVFALLGTTIGTSLLIGAKLGHPTQEDGQVTVDTAGAAAADIPSGVPGASGAAAQASGAPAAGARSAAPTTSRKSTSTKTTTGLKSGTYTGAGYNQEYGTVTVTITVSGGVVTRASATAPTGGRSSDINGAAVPKLNSEAVAAKTSASISTVSGATLTSNAYRLSMQSALDKAKA